ncbi:hypothetical protein N1851_024410 [Merluccius polli]|uniref:Uncharacterized protein n=1 Tax=Merluccius polli TaxID=89951 RepID=A0AA47NVP2_MERPO|nr:hypothetical protein N1851_024410 [Merluccius polli]
MFVVFPSFLPTQTVKEGFYQLAVGRTCGSSCHVSGGYSTSSISVLLIEAVLGPGRVAGQALLVGEPVDVPTGGDVGHLRLCGLLGGVKGPGREPERQEERPYSKRQGDFQHECTVFLNKNSKKEKKKQELERQTLGPRLAGPVLGPRLAGPVLGPQPAPRPGRRLSPQSGRRLSPRSGPQLAGPVLGPRPGRRLSPRWGPRLSPRSGPRLAGPVPGPQLAGPVLGPRLAGPVLGPQPAQPNDI